MNNYDNMYLLSDVCKITGLTKKIIRGYSKDEKNNKSGLLSPIKAPNGKYWLYSQKDLDLLMLITLLSECGLNRKEIIKYINNSEIDYEKNITDLIETLEEKKKQIDNTVRYLKTIRIFNRLPSLNNSPIIKSLLKKLNMQIKNGETFKTIYSKGISLESNFNTDELLDSDNEETNNRYILFTILSQILEGKGVEYVVNNNSEKILSLIKSDYDTDNFKNYDDKENIRAL